jgi:hypothetical protein
MSQNELSYAEDGTNGEVPVINISEEKCEENQEQAAKPKNPAPSCQRCVKCAAYMCRHSLFLAAGHQVLCHICGAQQDVPVHFYGPVDLEGKRVDGGANPQFHFGTFEYTLAHIPTSKPALAFCLDIGL